MTRVLIAVDESDLAVHATEVAHRLFGDNAEYLLINVGASPTSFGWSSGWGVAAPIGLPMVVNEPLPISDQATDEIEERAQDRAAEVADESDLADAEALGDTGDPAFAILDAADDHDVDVIVVGSHERSWFSRLISGSVSREVVRAATIPVLIVK